MRIAIVEPTGRGGLIHYAFQMARALSDAGAEVTLVTDRHYELDRLKHSFRVEKLFRLWDPKPAGEARAAPGALARRLRRVGRGVRHYREWWRLLGFLRRERFDVVQFGDIRFGTDCIGFAALAGAGVTVTDVCHNVLPFGGEGAGPLLRSGVIRTRLHRFIYHRCARVFVHGMANRAALLARFGLDADRVVAIRHGNLTVFNELRHPCLTQALVRRELGFDADAPVVLGFGTLSRYKGFDLLVEAALDILREEPRARLVIAGFPAPGFDVDALQRRARVLGVDRALRIVPRYIESGEIAAWLEMAAVAVFPYRFVFQSGAVNAACTAGVPVVATRVSGLVEAIEDGRTGVLVPPDDRPALAAGIVRLLRDRAFAATLGEGARNRALTDWSWTPIAADVLDHYRQIAAGRDGPSQAVRVRGVR